MGLSFKELAMNNFLQDASNLFFVYNRFKMRNKILYKKLSIFTLFILVIFLMFFPVIKIKAKSLDEIQREIEEKQKELEKIQSELEKKQSLLNNTSKSKRNTQSELNNVLSQIEQLKLEIEVNNLELSQMQINYDKKNLEKQEIEERQHKQLTALYMNWKGNSEFGAFLQEDPLKQKYYLEIVTESDQDGLNSTYNILSSMKKDLDGIMAKKQELDSKNQQLEKKKQELEKKLNALKIQEQSYASGIKQLKPKLTATQAELEQLSAEQKAMQDIESRLVEGDYDGGTLPLVSGEYYFVGQGRSLYQGHGVGLSQFGAYGAALHGWSAQQILQHYYTGVTIGQGSGTVNVIGPDFYINDLNLETYVAGAGEVPNKACGTPEQVAQRPDKYVVDNPSTVWDCWPEEAIKAQIIVYRTYGLRNHNVYNDARSQVYTGTTLKQWAADETRGQVVYYNGQLISAVYASDNNNGWGTANNDTVWSNYSGDGTPYPYLRAVYDENITYHYTWSNWHYRTNSYTFEEMNNMIIFGSTSSHISSGARSFMQSVRGDIGTLKSLSFVRDPSGRVKKVQLIGDKGNRYIAGWLFKSIWNIWIYYEEPSGERDYIYSLTYSLLQAP